MTDQGVYHSFYNTDDPQRWGRSEMPHEYETTKYWLTNLAVKNQSVVLELGCGIGTLRNIHPNYFGLDFSLLALEEIEKPAKLVNTDMQYLPFHDNSIDFIFSWAALRHVPNPEMVLIEIERVLKPAGVVLLAPAWFCRPWAAKGLPIKSYRELSWADRINKATIPVRNNILFRGLSIFPFRLYRELTYLFLRRSLRFDYRRLCPNLSEYVYTDCDAFTSMDPHAAIMYFVSRGWNILSHPTLSQRFIVRHEPLVLRKPFP